MTDSPPEGPQRILLIVDDEPQLRRMMSRLFSRHFDVVLTAGTVDEALEALLSHPVTHLMVDHNLGHGVPAGEYLIGVWRPKYPSIQRALLITGADIQSRRATKGIDQIVSKSDDPIRVLEALEG